MGRTRLLGALLLLSVVTCAGKKKVKAKPNAEESPADPAAVASQSDEPSSSVGGDASATQTSQGINSTQTLSNGDQSPQATTNPNQAATMNYEQTETTNATQPGATINYEQTETTNATQPGATTRQTAKIIGETGVTTGTITNQIGATTDQPGTSSNETRVSATKTATAVGETESRSRGKAGESGAAIQSGPPSVLIGATAGEAAFSKVTLSTIQAAATPAIDRINPETKKTDEEIEARWSQPNDAKIDTGGPIPTLDLRNTNCTIFRKRVNWFRAHDLCRKQNKILATFPTSESFDVIAQSIFDISVSDPYETNEFLGARRYWFGLNDLAGEGEWRWIDTGEKLKYADKFYPGQPDHIEQPSTLTHYVRSDGKGPSHCGLIWNPKFELGEKHVWDDAPCTDEQSSYHYFICQDYDDHGRGY